MLNGGSSTTRGKAWTDSGLEPSRSKAAIITIFRRFAKPTVSRPKTQCPGATALAR